MDGGETWGCEITGGGCGEDCEGEDFIVGVLAFACCYYCGERPMGGNQHALPSATLFPLFVFLLKVNDLT